MMPIDCPELNSRTAILISLGEIHSQTLLKGSDTKPWMENNHCLKEVRVLKHLSF